MSQRELTPLSMLWHPQLGALHWLCLLYKIQQCCTFDVHFRRKLKWCLFAEGSKQRAKYEAFLEVFWSLLFCFHFFFTIKMPEDGCNVSPLNYNYRLWILKKEREKHIQVKPWLSICYLTLSAEWTSSMTGACRGEAAWKGDCYLKKAHNRRRGAVSSQVSTRRWIFCH